VAMSPPNGSTESEPKVACSSCDGTGRVNGGPDSMGGVPCTTCDGTGRLSERRHYRLNGPWSGAIDVVVIGVGIATTLGLWFVILSLMNRLITWGDVLAFFIGLPLTILILGLSALSGFGLGGLLGNKISDILFSHRRGRTLIPSGF
jgi:hypothetical protein